MPDVKFCIVLAYYLYSCLNILYFAFCGSFFIWVEDSRAEFKSGFQLAQLVKSLIIV